MNNPRDGLPPTEDPPTVQYTPSTPAPTETAGTAIGALNGELIDGKYRIIEKLGSGGMGAVYKAEHALMNRIVAVKVLHPHLIESEEFLRRFKHEAQVASKLRHAHAVMIYDFGIFKNLAYLVMEYVEGKTLKQMIQETGAVTPAELAKILSQVAAALGEAHALGIVHRDLKPDNIIVSPSPIGLFARVLDFGIAKLVLPTASKEQTLATQAGMFFGTPRYASPEQALGKELDARSDIYSLGVILYEALTGEVPFDAPSMMELLLKHLHQQPPPLRSKHQGLSKAVEDVVLKCLAKERDDRFQSMSDLALRFGAAASEPTGATASNLQNALFIAAFVLLPVGGLTAYLLWPDGERGTEHTKEVVLNNDMNGVSETAVNIVTIPSALTTSTAVEATTSSFTPTTELPATTAQTLPETTISVSSTVTSPVLETDTTGWTLSSASTILEGLTSTTLEAPTTTLPMAASTLAGESPEILYRNADGLYRRRRYGEAIEVFERFIKKDPNFAKARLSLGICYLRVGRRTEALSQFQAADRLKPNYPPTHFNLACYYALTGDTERALSELEETIRLEPAARRWAVGEPDLGSIKKDPRYKALVN